MAPDVQKETTQGWVVCAGALVMVLIGLWVVSDGGSLAQQVADQQAAIKPGTQDLQLLVRRTEEANRVLGETIATLKRQVGFDTETAFEVADNIEFKRQPGYFFVLKRNAIIDRLRKRAHEKGIADFEEYAGFGVGQHRPPAESPPPDDQALDLLRMLQITDKAVSLCLETPTPLQKLLVKPHNVVKPVEVAAPGRAPLLKEYRLTLELRGSLHDILWILHRLSPGRDAPEADYPLILKDLLITSENRSPVDGVQLIDCTVTVAGMRFLSPEERGLKPGSLVSSGGRSSAATPSLTQQSRSF